MPYQKTYVKGKEPTKNDINEWNKMMEKNLDFKYDEKTRQWKTVHGTVVPYMHHVLRCEDCDYETTSDMGRSMAGKVGRVQWASCKRCTAHL